MVRPCGRGAVRLQQMAEAEEESTTGHRAQRGRPMVVQLLQSNLRPNRPDEGTQPRARGEQDAQGEDHAQHEVGTVPKLPQLLVAIRPLLVRVEFDQFLLFYE